MIIFHFQAQFQNFPQIVRRIQQQQMLSWPQIIQQTPLVGRRIVQCKMGSWPKRVKTSMRSFLKKQNTLSYYNPPLFRLLLFNLSIRSENGFQISFFNQFSIVLTKDNYLVHLLGKTNFMKHEFFFIYFLSIFTRQKF